MDSRFRGNDGCWTSTPLHTRSSPNQPQRLRPLQFVARFRSFLESEVLRVLVHFRLELLEFAGETFGRQRGVVELPFGDAARRTFAPAVRLRGRFDRRRRRGVRRSRLPPRERREVPQRLPQRVPCAPCMPVQRSRRDRRIRAVLPRSRAPNARAAGSAKDTANDVCDACYCPPHPPPDVNVNANRRFFFAARLFFPCFAEVRASGAAMNHTHFR